MTTWTKFATPVVSVLIAALTPPAHAAPPRYRLTVLEPLPGCSESDARAINAKGQVAANALYSACGANGKPFLWQAGRSTPLRKDAQVFDINYAGWMTGYHMITPGVWEAVILKPGGAMTVIPFDGERRATGRAINNRNKVVGEMEYVFLGHPSTFLYVDGVVTDLGLHGVNYVSSINDLDQIAGGCSDKACIYHNGHVRRLNTGFLASSSTAWATDINQAGQVVGSYVRPGGVHYRGFLLDGAVLTDLGNVVPLDIDNDGNIVGELIERFAFIRTGGRTYNLNKLTTNLGGFKLTTARQINSRGQIVGTGKTASGHSRGFLLTPIASSASTD
jgi:uncharacterized membrane protein